MIMASMRNWLHGEPLDADGEGGDDGSGGAGAAAAEKKKRRFSLKSAERIRQENQKKRVVVVHCKAGKGRSGTVSCSYLISEEGWTPEDALARFTARRMRPKFGAGVSIPSQLRTIAYVDRWTKGGKRYVDRPVEIVEIHVWGLRNGVKVDVAGFGDEGKRIDTLHTFRKEERFVVEGDPPDGGGLSDMVWSMAGYSTDPRKEAPQEAPLADSANLDKPGPKKSHTLKERGSNLIHKAASSTSLHKESKAKDGETGSIKDDGSGEAEPGGKAVILRPAQPILVENSDVQVAVERRNKTNKSLGFTMVTAVAHVWFNPFFEGNGPEQGGKPDDNGVFSIEWEAMDGIKGSSRKGARALDRIAVVWRFAGGDDGGEDGTAGRVVDEPTEGQPVPQLRAADWKGGNGAAAEKEKDLGLRTQSPESADVSKASSILTESGEGRTAGDDDGSFKGVRTSGPTGEELPVRKRSEKEAEEQQVGGDDEGRRQDAAELIDSPDTATGTTKAGDTKVV